MYFEVEIKTILEFLIDNIFVVVGDLVFQQSVGIPMDTNCAPLLAGALLKPSFRKFYCRYNDLVAITDYCRGIC
jgi:hypothetical protein